VQAVWLDDVTGDKGPAESFRKDQSIDACFAITPDMMSLTGGPDATGTGEKSTVKGAHVLVSTAQMMRSIADVYACRRDYFDKHKDVIEKFTAGYLKACEELVSIKKTGKDKTAKAYNDVLALTRKMFGTDVRNDEEADGLISDAVFVGLPGNYSFFQDKGNLSGFDAKARAAVDLALSLKDADKRYDLTQANLDYSNIKKIGDLSARVDASRTGRFAPNAQEKGVIYSFNVYFGGNRSDFPEAQYGQHFQRAAEQASLFGNAMISIRGHANGSEMMIGFRNTVLKRGIVTERGGKYFLKDGSEFAMNDMKAILDLIKKENLGEVNIRASDRPTIQGQIDLLQELSERRSESVRRAVVDYATRHGYRLDPSQMKFVGVGGSEPVVMFAGEPEGGKNRRVEFRIIAVSAEAITTEEFDF
jgi:outer membrane protein OmpA-like peptidoglycan-associated protein